MAKSNSKRCKKAEDPTYSTSSRLSGTTLPRMSLPRKIKNKKVDEELPIIRPTIPMLRKGRHRLAGTKRISSHCLLGCRSRGKMVTDTLLTLSIRGNKGHPLLVAQMRSSDADVMDHFLLPLSSMKKTESKSINSTKLSNSTFEFFDDRHSYTTVEQHSFRVGADTLTGHDPFHLFVESERRRQRKSQLNNKHWIMSYKKAFENRCKTRWLQMNYRYRQPFYDSSREHIINKTKRLIDTYCEISDKVYTRI